MKLLDLHPCAPPLAVWDGRTWQHGPAAIAACRVDPQSVCSDLLEQLSLIPLPGRRGPVRHRADLLADLLRSAPKAPTIAAVPAHWEKETLQLFLGAAQAAELPVRWLLPRCLLLAAALPPAANTDTLTLFEWSWNRLTQITLAHTPEKGWHLQRHQSIPDAGIFACFRRDAWRAQDHCLDLHRVDPLHSGHTEQALFQSWWTSLQHGEDWCISLPGGNQTRLPRAPLAALHPTPVPDGPDRLLPLPLRHLWQWTRAQTEPATLPIPDLPDHDAPGARWRSSFAASAPPAEPATHALIGHTAHPLPHPAAPGDAVVLPDGRTATAIRVIPHHAPA